MTATLTLPVELQLTPKSQALFDALMKLGQPAEATATTPTTSQPTIGSVWQGGIYAGISRGEDGQPDGHIVLLDVKPAKALTWEKAKAWAAALGDDARLPTKVEAALLYANLKGEFQTDDGYWTETPYSDTGAWYQFFDYGGQYGNSQSGTCLARAVRRFPL